MADVFLCHQAAYLGALDAVDPTTAQAGQRRAAGSRMTGLPPMRCRSQPAPDHTRLRIGFGLEFWTAQCPAGGSRCPTCGGANGASIAKFRTRRPLISAKPRNTARFLSTFIFDALETDWLVGAGGFEPLHFGIRSAGVGHRLRLSLASRWHDNFTRDAHVRLLPPQRASPSLTHTELGRAGEGEDHVRPRQRLPPQPEHPPRHRHAHQRGL